MCIDRIDGLEPVVQWPGGKRQLLPVILERVPDSYGTYHEPFVGGGTVWLALQPKKAWISDKNGHLINMYQAIQSQIDAVVDLLKTLENNEEQYYKAREQFNHGTNLSSAERAALLLFLNKTCYNGLYRENSKREFNASYGCGKLSKRIDFVCEGKLRKLHSYLNKANIRLKATDVRNTLKDVRKNDFVYLDPPYDGVYTDYQAGRFGWMDQCTVRGYCDELTSKGAKWLLSNADTPRIRELYRDYNIESVTAKYRINTKSKEANKPTGELLIRNYEGGVTNE